MLIGTWENELEKFGAKDCDVSISSYDSLKNREEDFKRAQLIIGDEGHYLKNIEAKRTICFENYIETHRPERMILLTGTAIKNRITEFYSLLALCAYNLKETSGINVLDEFPTFYHFARTFCEQTQFKVQGRIVTKWEGHKNIELFKTLLEGKYLRRRASQVLNLPSIVRKDVILDSHIVDKELLAAWNEGKGFATAKVNSAKIKVPHTVRYIKDLEDQGETPILVFSAHVEPAKELANILGYELITGETPLSRRDEIVRNFQAGKVKGLSATIGALGVGVTLTKSTNLVFNDLGFVPGDIAQVEKRIHRIGQEGSCVVHRILWGAIDLHICRELDKKLETLKEVL